MPAAPCKLIELDTQTDSRFAYEKEKDCCFQWHTSEQIRATQKKQSRGSLLSRRLLAKQSKVKSDLRARDRKSVIGLFWILARCDWLSVAMLQGRHSTVRPQICRAHKNPYLLLLKLDSHKTFLKSISCIAPRYRYVLSTCFPPILGTGRTKKIKQNV